MYRLHSLKSHFSDGFFSVVHSKKVGQQKEKTVGMSSEMPSWRLELGSQSVKTMLDMTGWRYSRPTSLSAASRERITPWTPR